MREKQKWTLDQLADTLRKRQEECQHLQRENYRLLRRAAALEVLAGGASEAMLSLAVVSCGTCDPVIAAVAAAAAAAQAAAAPPRAGEPPLGPAAVVAAADAAVAAAATQEAAAAAACKQQHHQQQQQGANHVRNHFTTIKNGKISPEGGAAGHSRAVTGAGAHTFPLDHDQQHPGEPRQDCGHQQQQQQEGRPQQQEPQRQESEPAGSPPATGGGATSDAAPPDSCQALDGAGGAAVGASSGAGLMDLDGAEAADGAEQLLLLKEHQQAAAPRPRNSGSAVAATEPLALLRLPRVAELSTAVQALLRGGGARGAPWGLAATAGFAAPEGSISALGVVLDPTNVAVATLLSPSSALESYTAFVMEALLLQTLLDRDFGMDGLGQQLVGILESNLGWIFAGWVWNQPAIMSLFTRNLITGDAAAVPPATHWVECVRALRPTGQQVLYLGEVRRIVRDQQAALIHRWRRRASDLGAAVLSGSFERMEAAAGALDAVVQRWEVVNMVQALSWIGAVTPQQMARLCARAFPYAPNADAVLEHILMAADAAAAAAAAAAERRAAEAAEEAEAAAAAALPPGPRGSGSGGRGGPRKE